MNNLGDFYAVVLQDDGLRAACTPTDGRPQPRWRPLAAARASLAAGLRLVAAVLDGSATTPAARPRATAVSSRTASARPA